MKTLLTTTIIFLLASFNVKAQETQRYNLPPGAVSNLKTTEVIDYSFKLRKNLRNNNQNNSNFLSNYSKNDLETMSQNNPEAYKYFMTANEYYNNLSENVKKIYTIDELWYIYIYDQNLKESLKTL